MLRAKQNWITVASFAAVCVLFTVITFFLTSGQSFLFSFITAAIVLCILTITGSALNRSLLSKIEYKVLYESETGLLNRFIERIRFCYTLDDFIRAVSDICENEGGISVLYVDKAENQVLYNSSSYIACAEQTKQKLDLNFPAEWADGYYFFDGELGLVSKSRQARGFFIASDKRHLYFFCRYVHLFDEVIFPRLFAEIKHFQLSEKTFTGMSEISSLSKEWASLADTQRSFLQIELPKINKLDMAAYYRPLVNISGDYYQVFPISDHKTLVMLGDVSGKGLAAALLMGVIMNTVRILKNKEDLNEIIFSVDKAIKGMHLQDKYTVMFLALIDTAQMNITYVNASMADPVIISRAPDGGRLRFLKSNASLVGIIDMEPITPVVQKLYTGDVLFIASDGVSEAMNEEGVELGTTEQFERVLKKSFVKTARNFVNDVVDLVFVHSGIKHLRDDVSIVAVKIGASV